MNGVAEAGYAPTVPEPIRDLLACPTPAAWLDWAARSVDTLLLDHANCEKKAAATAVGMLFRYGDRDRLTAKMSRLAREELRHYEQVCRHLAKRSIARRPVAASGYAAALRALVRSPEPEQLVDRLICGAFIEARSCERFAALIPLLDEELARFYSGLLASESRHFQDYLSLANDVSETPLEERIAAFAECEREAVMTPSRHFAFHSGPPWQAANDGA